MKLFPLCLQSLPVFTFANQAGFDMLETTLLALQDITLDKIFDEAGQKSLSSDFGKIMQQVEALSSSYNSYGLVCFKIMLCSRSAVASAPGALLLVNLSMQGFACLPAGICISTMGRHVSYEQAIAWKVLTEENTLHCIAFSFGNWSFV